MDAATITVLTTGIIGIIGAIVAGTVTIIKALRETKSLVAAGQEVGMASGAVRDAKMQEIHILVNSRVLMLLRLVAKMTKSEAERTGRPEDILAFQTAMSELIRAEDADKVLRDATSDTDPAETERVAQEAATRLRGLISNVKAKA